MSNAMPPSNEAAGAVTAPATVTPTPVAVQFASGSVSVPGRSLVLAPQATAVEVREALAHSFGLLQVDLAVRGPAAGMLAEQSPLGIIQRDWLLMERGAGEALIAGPRVPDLQQRDTIGSTLDVSQVRSMVSTRQGLYDTVHDNFSESLQDEAENGLIRGNPRASASFGIPVWQRMAAVVAVLLLLTAAFVWPGRPLVVLTVAGNLLFLAGAMFKASMSIIGLFAVRNQRQPAPLPEPVEPSLLPRYTILVPVLHERNVIEQLLHHLGGLDYPAERLQVLVLLEATDAETIAAARASSPPDFMSIVIVPEGAPMTKPRACNYGLQLATGEFTVIYDAEDRPESDQLLRIVAEFAELPDEVVCVQAALNYYNAEENVLTRMFALEYSAWFDAMLPGLSATAMPIPLGGTSNHFRTAQLRALGGWDPFNVTEDAELGLRAQAQGLRVQVNVAATTWEEACSDRGAGIRQRTRWIKGYMVTALVQLRHPWQYFRNFGWRGIAEMVGLIAGTPLMFLAYPLLWAVTLLGLIGLVSVASVMPEWLLNATFINAVVGNLFAIGITALTGWRRHGWRIAAYALLNPIYWFMHSAAAWRALWQLLRSPFHWEKTPHGLTDTHAPASRAATPPEALA